ncbi:DUF2076 family protein [uncultured Oxalicibacterium sp.]|uniref:DUF2076 domain-containing protein n=1 Tax=uncultured Oxalicibacterium sp. TaxID=1168540 RepID=UPI0025ED1AE4|nr:DUF2076 family protein [uncultured Oxalicibacterium sp.]
MNQQDREAIDAVFQRVAEVERQGAPRDAEAERVIAEHLRANPAAAYYLAQTVIVQEQALKNVRQDQAATSPKDEELSAAGTPLRSSNTATNPPSSATGSGFGNEGFGRTAPATPNYAPQQPAGASQFGNSAGGGFLAGAAQTALGVTGGVLLGSMLGNMFGANNAHAADAAGKDAKTESTSDQSGAGADSTAASTERADDGGFGSWFGGGDDGGGFDDI